MKLTIPTIRLLYLQNVCDCAEALCLAKLKVNLVALFTIDIYLIFIQNI